MPNDLGRLDQDDDRWLLTFTRRLGHPPEKVFAALTEAEHLRAWFPTDIEGERAAGAKLRFVFRDNPEPPVDGEMLAYDPPRRVEYLWGDETLRFDLEPAGDGGTLLTFVNRFVEVGKAARDGAGWHACLDELADHLDGRAGADSGERWREVHPLYQEALGPAASTIGPPEWFDDGA